MSLIGGKHKRHLTMLVYHIDINSLIKSFHDLSGVAVIRSREEI